MSSIFLFKEIFAVAFSFLAEPNESPEKWTNRSAACHLVYGEEKMTRISERKNNLIYEKVASIVLQPWRLLKILKTKTFFFGCSFFFTAIVMKVYWIGIKDNMVIQDLSYGYLILRLLLWMLFKFNKKNIR